MFLLDTMTVSEPTKTRPDARVAAWMEAAETQEHFVSALSFGEIEFGILRMAPGRRRDRLHAWLAADLRDFFRDRILPVDELVAAAWAQMRHGLKRTPSQIDSLIAATALAHGLTIVTRNERDFAALGVRVVNPWA